MMFDHDELADDHQQLPSMIQLNNTQSLSYITKPFEIEKLLAIIY